MDMSLTKLPWYAQVGAFVVLAVGGVGAFFYYYEMPAQRRHGGARDAAARRCAADIAKGQATARKLPEFRAQVADLEGRLDSLKAVLPEEKDAADLLRRMQTVATQSNLTIKSFKPAPIVTKQLHAEWPISLELDGTYHNLAIFFDRVGKFTRIVNISAPRRQRQGQAGRRTRRSPRPAWRPRSCCSTSRAAAKPASATGEPARRRVA